MKWHKVPWLLIISLMVLFPAGGCGSGGPFTIKADSFAASDVCNGKGTVQNQMVSGELSSRLLEGGYYDMLQTGKPTIWCDGLTHVWLGTSTYEGYTFASDPDDPLQFVVNRQKGYRYVGGKGTVTTPDGDVVTLK